MTRVAVIAITVMLAAFEPAAQERSVARLPPALSGPVDFVRDVQPILEASHARCHACGRAKGGFGIESRDTLTTPAGPRA